MEDLKNKLQKFNDELLEIPLVKQIFEATNVPPMFYALAVVTVSVVLVAFNLSISGIIVQLVSIAWPAYKSHLALQTEGKDDDKQWLTYWMIYGVFAIVDSSFGCFLSCLPFYFLFRLLFIIWLQNPMTQGALELYSKVVKPFAIKHKVKIAEVNE